MRSLIVEFCSYFLLGKGGQNISQGKKFEQSKVIISFPESKINNTGQIITIYQSIRKREFIFQTNPTNIQDGTHPQTNTL